MKNYFLFSRNRNLVYRKDYLDHRTFNFFGSTVVFPQIRSQCSSKPWSWEKTGNGMVTMEPAECNSTWPQARIVTSVFELRALSFLILIGWSKTNSFVTYFLRNKKNQLFLFSQFVNNFQSGSFTNTSARKKLFRKLEKPPKLSWIPKRYIFVRRFQRSFELV